MTQRYSDLEAALEEIDRSKSEQPSLPATPEPTSPIYSELEAVLEEIDRSKSEQPSLPATPKPTSPIHSELEEDVLKVGHDEPESPRITRPLDYIPATTPSVFNQVHPDMSLRKRWADANGDPATHPEILAIGNPKAAEALVQQQESDNFAQKYRVWQDGVNSTPTTVESFITEIDAAEKSGVGKWLRKQFMHGLDAIGVSNAMFGAHFQRGQADRLQSFIEGKEPKLDTAIWRLLHIGDANAQLNRMRAKENDMMHKALVSALEHETKAPRSPGGKSEAFAQSVEELTQSEEGAGFWRRVRDTTTGLATAVIRDPDGSVLWFVGSTAYMMPTMLSAMAVSSVSGVGGIGTGIVMGGYQETAALPHRIIAETGHDVSTPEGRNALVADTNALDQLEQYARTRFLIIGLAEIATVGAHRLYSPISSRINAISTQHVVGRGALKLGDAMVKGIIEGTGEAAGEGFAQVATGDEVSNAELGLSFALGGLLGVPESFIARGGFSANKPIPQAVSALQDDMKRDDAYRYREQLKSGGKLIQQRSEQIKSTHGDGWELWQFKNLMSTVQAMNKELGGQIMVQVDAEALQNFINTTKDQYDTQYQHPILNELGLTPDELAKRVENDIAVSLHGEALMKAMIGEHSYEKLLDIVRKDEGSLTTEEADAMDGELEDKVDSTISHADTIKEQVDVAWGGAENSDIVIAQLPEIAKDVSAKLQKENIFSSKLKAKPLANNEITHYSDIMGEIIAMRYSARALRASKQAGEFVTPKELYDLDVLQFSASEDAETGANFGYAPTEDGNIASVISVGTEPSASKFIRGLGSMWLLQLGQDAKDYAVDSSDSAFTDYNKALSYLVRDSNSISHIRAIIADNIPKDGIIVPDIPDEVVAPVIHTEEEADTAEIAPSVKEVAPEAPASHRPQVATTPPVVPQPKSQPETPGVNPDIFEEAVIPYEIVARMGDKIMTHPSADVQTPPAELQRDASAPISSKDYTDAENERLGDPYVMSKEAELLLSDLLGVDNLEQYLKVVGDEERIVSISGDGGEPYDIIDEQVGDKFLGLSLADIERYRKTLDKEFAETRKRAHIYYMQAGMRAYKDGVHVAITRIDELLRLAQTAPARRAKDVVDIADTADTADTADVIPTNPHDIRLVRDGDITKIDPNWLQEYTPALAFVQIIENSYIRSIQTILTQHTDNKGNKYSDKEIETQTLYFLGTYGIVSQKEGYVLSYSDKMFEFSSKKFLNELAEIRQHLASYIAKSTPKADVDVTPDERHAIEARLNKVLETTGRVDELVAKYPNMVKVSSEGVGRVDGEAQILRVNIDVPREVGRNESEWKKGRRKIKVNAGWDDVIRSVARGAGKQAIIEIRGTGMTASALGMLGSYDIGDGVIVIDRARYDKKLEDNARDRRRAESSQAAKADIVTDESSADLNLGAEMDKQLRVSVRKHFRNYYEEGLREYGIDPASLPPDLDADMVVMELVNKKTEGGEVASRLMKYLPKTVVAAPAMSTAEVVDALFTEKDLVSIRERSPLARINRDSDVPSFSQNIKGWMSRVTPQFTKTYSKGVESLGINYETLPPDLQGEAVWDRVIYDKTPPTTIAEAVLALIASRSSNTKDGEIVAETSLVAGMPTNRDAYTITYHRFKDTPISDILTGKAEKDNYTAHEFSYKFNFTPDLAALLMRRSLKLVSDSSRVVGLNFGEKSFRNPEDATPDNISRIIKEVSDAALAQDLDVIVRSHMAINTPTMAAIKQAIRDAVPYAKVDDKAVRGEFVRISHKDAPTLADSESLESRFRVLSPQQNSRLYSEIQREVDDMILDDSRRIDSDIIKRTIDASDTEAQKTLLGNITSQDKINEVARNLYPVTVALGNVMREQGVLDDSFRWDAEVYKSPLASEFYYKREYDIHKKRQAGVDVRKLEKLRRKLTYDAFMDGFSDPSGTLPIVKKIIFPSAYPYSVELRISEGTFRGADATTLPQYFSDIVDRVYTHANSLGINVVGVLKGFDESTRSTLIASLQKYLYFDADKSYFKGRLKDGDRFHILSEYPHDINSIDRVNRIRRKTTPDHDYLLQRLAKLADGIPEVAVPEPVAQETITEAAMPEPVEEEEAITAKSPSPKPKKPNAVKPASKTPQLKGGHRSRAEVMEYFADMSDADLRALVMQGKRGDSISDIINDASIRLLGEVFEVYIGSGHYPTSTLQSLFDKATSWLREVSSRVALKGITLPPEITAIMDRLLASEAEIDAMAARYEFNFMAREMEKFMTKKEYINYNKNLHRAHKAAQNALIRKHILAQTTERNREFKRIKADVAYGLARQPKYMLLAALTNDGKLLDGTELPDDIKVPVRINKPKLKRHTKDVGELPRGKNGRAIYTTRKESMSPENAADIFGYDSVRDMIIDLQLTIPFAQQVKIDADATIAARYPNTTVDDAVLAVHGTKELTSVLTAELEVLSRHGYLAEAFKAHNVRSIARELLGKLPLRRLSAKNLDAEAVRFSKLAALYFKKKDYPKAAKFRYNQLLRHYMIRYVEGYAHDARNAKRLIEKYHDTHYQSQTIAADYLDAIKEIARQVYTGEVPSDRVQSKYSAADMEAYLGQLTGDKYPSVPLTEGIRAVWDDRILADNASYDLIMEFMRQIKALESMGRQARGGATLAAQNTYNHDRNIWAQQVAMFKKIRPEAEDKKVDFGNHIYSAITTMRKFASSINTDLLPLVTIGHILDQHRFMNAATGDIGFIQKHFVLPLLDLAGLNTDAYQLAVVHTGKHLQKSQKAHYKYSDKKLKRVRALIGGMEHFNSEVPNIDGELDPLLFASPRYNAQGKDITQEAWIATEKPQRITYGHLLAIALNWGNADNRAKLMSSLDMMGYDITEEQLLAILEKHMLPSTWDAVQGIWDMHEAMWPAANEWHRTRYGTDAKKVRAESFDITMQDGTTRTMTGGYYVVAYNQDAATRYNSNARTITGILSMDQDSLMNFRYAEGFFRHVDTSMFQERKLPSKRIISLDLNHVFNSFHMHLHTITHAAAISKVMALLRDPVVINTIRTYYGDSMYNALVHFMGRAAASDYNQRPQTQIQAFVAWLQKNLTRSILGLSARTILAQQLGLPPGVHHILHTNPDLSAGERMALSANVSGLVAKFTALHASDPMAVRYDEPAYRSIMMKNRRREFDLVHQRIHDSANQTMFKTGKAPLQDLMLLPIAYSQYIVDRTVWMTSYLLADQANGTRTPMTKKQKVAYADNVVRRSQGSGEPVNLSAIVATRDGFTRLFTMFMTYFNQLYAEVYAVLRHTSDEGIRKTAGKFFTGWFLMLIIPAILSQFMLGDADELLDLFDEDADLTGRQKAMIYMNMAGLGELTLGVPLLNIMYERGIGGNRRDISPIGDVYDSVDSIVGYISEEEWDNFHKALRGGVTLAGAFTGAVPSAQINRALRLFEYRAKNRDDAADMSSLEILHRLINGQLPP